MVSATRRIFYLCPTQEAIVPVEWYFKMRTTVNFGYN